MTKQRKPADRKRADRTPVDNEPAARKALDSKPATSTLLENPWFVGKPVDSKPTPSKAAGRRAAGSKAAGSKPAINTSAASEPAASKPAGNKPAANKSAETRRPDRAAAKPKQVGSSEAADKGPGLTGLDPKRVALIREFAIELARRAVEPGVVMICNPITEPSALPAKELLYDRCRWCDKDIYYDRMMPSPPDIQRVCIACYLLMAEAEKKGAN